MATQTLRKHVWLIETIRRHQRLTFREINDEWQRNDSLSEGNDLELRTFHKWRKAISDIFGIHIRCSACDYCYYIDDINNLKSGSVSRWLLENVSASNLLMSNLALKDRILVEDVPSGAEALTIILDAMKTDSVLTITYKSFWRNEKATFDIHPYCVKLFKQRWYVVAHCPNFDSIRIYALDRIDNIEKHATNKFRLPKKFDAAEFFMNYYGVVANTDTPKETVRIKVKAPQSKYLSSLKLHWSQEEPEKNEEYSVFTMSLCPEYDFEQELLSMGPDVEVLAPEWLRQEIAEKVKSMYNIYWKKKK